MFFKLLSVNAPKKYLQFRLAPGVGRFIGAPQLRSAVTATYSFSEEGPWSPATGTISVPDNVTDVFFRPISTGAGSFITLNSADLEEVVSWGTQTTVEGIRLNDCNKLTKVPSELWAACRSTEDMFLNSALLNDSSIASWDTSNVVNMRRTFGNCPRFNVNIGSWDVSHVSEFGQMFINCPLFNADIGDWNMSSAVDIRYMFYGCSSFNRSIARWNVSKVTSLMFMFYGASSYNQDLSTLIFKSSAERSAYDTGATAWNSAYRPKFTGA